MPIFSRRKLLFHVGAAAIVPQHALHAETSGLDEEEIDCFVSDSNIAGFHVVATSRPEDANRELLDGSILFREPALTFKTNGDVIVGSGPIESRLDARTGVAKARYELDAGRKGFRDPHHLIIIEFPSIEYFNPYDQIDGGYLPDSSLPEGALKFELTGALSLPGRPQPLALEGIIPPVVAEREPLVFDDDDLLFEVCRSEEPVLKLHAVNQAHRDFMLDITVDFKGLSRAIIRAEELRVALKQRLADHPRATCSSRSPCVLTTASVEMLGRTDDCFELRMMRRLRARYLHQTEILRDYVETSQRLLARGMPGRLNAALVLFWLAVSLPAAFLVALGLFPVARRWYLAGFSMLRAASGWLAPGQSSAERAGVSPSKGGQE